MRNQYVQCTNIIRTCEYMILYTSLTMAKLVSQIPLSIAQLIGCTATLYVYVDNNDIAEK